MNSHVLKNEVQGPMYYRTIIHGGNDDDNTEGVNVSEVNKDTKEKNCEGGDDKEDDEDEEDVRFKRLFWNIKWILATVSAKGKSCFLF
jgi:hypothetical protein